LAPPALEHSDTAGIFSYGQGANFVPVEVSGRADVDASHVAAAEGPNVVPFYEGDSSSKTLPSSEFPDPLDPVITVNQDPGLGLHAEDSRIVHGTTVHEDAEAPSQESRGATDSVSVPDAAVRESTHPDAKAESVGATAPVASVQTQRLDQESHTSGGVAYEIRDNKKPTYVSSSPFEASFGNPSGFLCNDLLKNPKNIHNMEDGQEKAKAISKFVYLAASCIKDQLVRSPSNLQEHLEVIAGYAVDFDLETESLSKHRTKNGSPAVVEGDGDADAPVEADAVTTTAATQQNDNEAVTTNDHVDDNSTSSE